MKIKRSFMAALSGALVLAAAASCTGSDTDKPDQPTATFPDFSEVTIGNGESHTFTVNSEADFFISISDSDDRNRTALNFTMTEQGVNTTSITKDERRCNAGEHTFAVTADAASYDESPSCTVWMRVGSQTEKIRTITIDRLDRTTTIYTASLDQDGYWTTGDDNQTVYTKVDDGRAVVMQFNRFNGKNTFEARIKVETNVDEWSFASTPDWVTTHIDGDICTFGIDASKLSADQLRNGIADASFTLQDISTGHYHAALGTYGIVLPAAGDIAYAYFMAYRGNGSYERLKFIENGKFDDGNTQTGAAGGSVVGADTRLAVAYADKAQWNDGDIALSTPVKSQENALVSTFTLSLKANSGYNRTAYILAFAGSVPAGIDTADVVAQYPDNIMAAVNQSGALGRADGWILDPLDEYGAMDAGAKFERLDDKSEYASFVATVQGFDASYSDVQVYRLTYRKTINQTEMGPMPVSYEAAFKLAGYPGFSAGNIDGHAGSPTALDQAVIKAHDYPAAMADVTIMQHWQDANTGYYCLDFSDILSVKSWGGLWTIYGGGKPVVVIDLWFDPDAQF